MDENVQEDLVPIVIDLNAMKDGTLNEAGPLGMLGSWVKSILSATFSGANLPVTVQGNPTEIKSFAGALQGEKRYIEAYNKFGLDNPQTWKSKAQLQNAVAKFERATGIMWPFK